MRGADIIIFVADSQRERMGANERALKFLAADLQRIRTTPQTKPVILVSNKVDLQRNDLSRSLADALLPWIPAHFVETSATTGEGLDELIAALTAALGAT
jgi:50S ribosomal subunit-associated GTPase HflX